MQPPVPDNFHPLLKKQIESVFGHGAELSPETLRLLEAVNHSYGTADKALDDAKQQVAHRTEQLMASTSKAYSFLDSINMGFIMCDTSGEIVLANSSLRHMLDSKPRPYNAPKLEGTLTVDVLDAEFGPELGIKNLIRQCLDTNQVISRDDVNYGRLVLHLYLAPLRNESNSEELLGAILLFEDVTEQKLLNRSKDEFLSIASHELRTPLTAIRGNASLFKKLYGDKINDPEQMEVINDIHESSVRLIEIVNDFLDVAAMEQHKIVMKPESLSINDIASEVVHELANLCAEKGIELKADASLASVPNVVADRQRTKQVLINLVGNAVKFTEKGNITISAEADNKFVYTTVTDTGVGMSPENQKLLFRKFQQAGDDILTRNTTKGTGLGLYISKQIVELSGGQIGLKSSAEGVGSEFVFSLPIAQTEVQQKQI